jgi:hypothetical protein
MANGTIDRLTSILEQMAAGVPSNKTAEEAPRPGGQADAKSSHPTTDKSEDGLVSNPTGELIKADASMLASQGQANISDKAPVSPTESQEEVEIEAGLKRTGIGNDPSVEKDMVGNLAEPGVGTSHPAQFDDGAKYAADFAKMSPAEQVQSLSKLANDVLADLLVGQKRAGQTTPTPAPVDGAPQISDELLQHAQRGYAAAKTAQFDKQAAAAQVLHSVINDAQLDAALVAEHFQKVAEEAAAEEDATSEGSAGAPPGESADAGGPPSGGGESGGESGGAPSAGDLMSAAEQAPGASPVNPQDAVAELAAVLAELGITPDQLEALIAGGGMGGGDAGGMPPEAAMGGGDMGGGMPPEAAMGGAMGGGMPPDPVMGGAKMAMLTGQRAAKARMVASRVRAYKQAGYAVPQAPTTPARKQLRALAKQALTEILGR